MPESGTKPKKVKKIIYHPKKGYKTSIRILLSTSGILSTKQIGENLSESGEVSGRQIKNKMEDLATLGYCSEYRTVRNPELFCENCKKSNDISLKQ